jgi:hypothetical protein
MNPRFGEMMMNRWLQVVISISFNLFIGGNVWAVCEAELEKLISISAQECAYTKERDVSFCQLDFPSKKRAEHTRALADQHSPATPEAIRAGEADLAKMRATYDKGLIAQRVIAVYAYNYCMDRRSTVKNNITSNTSTENAPNLLAAQTKQAQQSAEQAQQLAQQNQARADQARQGKRRRHEPENEASQCIQPDFGGLYGGMKNTCNFKVWYTYCGYRPKENSWLTGMSCEKQKFGSDSVSPGRTSAAHTKGVEMLYWIACKEPAWTVDTEFVPGQGLRGRCHTVGGN